MIKNAIKKIVRHIAFKHGRGVTIWHWLCHPCGDEWAAWLKIHGGLYSMGEHCSIQRSCILSDPAYTRFGNNVRASGVKFFGHDGSINMINRALGKKLDSVGKIDIGDDVTIGDGSVIHPGVTLGSRVIILSGAHVSKDVPSGTVYGGVPAKFVCTFEEYVDRKETTSNAYPWIDLIEQREGSFDPELEPTLVKMRVAHFYGKPA